MATAKSKEASDENLIPVLTAKKNFCLFPRFRLRRAPALRKPAGSSLRVQYVSRSVEGIP
jgi:hypothetical protein